jgi:hypothetical protein
MGQKGFVNNAVGLRFRNIRDRIDAIRHYGGNPPRCACCGEDQFSLLSIDHIDGGGNEEREKLFGDRRLCGHDMYRYLRNNGFPDGYQVLCYSCNTGKRDNMGNCPHKVPAPSPDEFLRLFDVLRVGQGNWAATETDEYQAAFQAVQRKWQFGKKTEGVSEAD